MLVWKILTFVYKYFFSSDTKLLVITGEWEIAAGEIFWPNDPSAFTEVIDFSEEKLVCDTFTTDYERHSYFGMTGGLIKENIPLICGPLLNGALKQRLGECFIFGQKNKIVKMSYSRAGGSSAIVINDKVSPVEVPECYETIKAYLLRWMNRWII